MKSTCAIHGFKLIVHCPACLGEARSQKKAESSRENGKLGGRGNTRKKRLKKNG